MKQYNDGVEPGGNYSFVPASTYNVLDPVQNAWYTAITLTNSMIGYAAHMQNSGAPKDMGVRLTIDGNVVTGNGVNPDGVLAYSYISPTVDALTITATETLAAFGLPIYANSFKMEIRQIDAVVAGQRIYAYVRSFGS